MRKQEYHIASFSGGKDSTAMVLHMIELGSPLDEVLYCDTTMEFPAMLRHIEKVRKVVENARIKFTVIRANHDFEYFMLHHKPNRKKEELKDKVGYSWPGSLSRWCTEQLKKMVIERHLRTLREKYEVIQYIGIAADEGYRLDRKNNQAPNMRFPLVEWGWDESTALNYCLSKGYDWEGLYEIFKRVSCWCCPLQSLDELRKLRLHFPELWERLKNLDKQTWRTFKPNNQSVENLEKRFDLEIALTESGHSIKDRRFFDDLQRLIAKEVTILEILQERTGKEATRA